MAEDPRIEELQSEVRELRDRLEEATATLDAIRGGDVDALIVGDAGRERIFTLEGADHPYRVLIEAMRQGAATLGADGTILFCNGALAAMLRTAQERVSGAPLSRFVPAADQALLDAMLRQAQASHSVGEIRFLAGDATPLPVQLALSALPLAGATALGLIVTDLTDQKRQEELEATHRRKDDFLAILAHELRNPLAPIRTAVHLLKTPGADGMAERARDMIERQVGNLTRLVDELLDVSRINRDKIQLVKEPVDLAAVARRAAEAAQPLVEQRRHALSLFLPQEPLWLEADPTRLEQVVVNLLNNAAKYTEPGGRIALEARREGGLVVLSVTDTGVGIAPDLLPHVFEMFTQADHSLDRSQGGLGIGLTLVRRLIDLHGGEISGHSDGLGKGSCFTVRLPALSGGPAPAPAAAEDRADGSSAPLRIMVIDDNRDAGESLGTLLELSGHQVQVFDAGASALEAALTFRPDVVLLDIGLPEMDGYQVAHHLRRQPGGAGLFLVAVTGYGQEEDRRRAAAAGFDLHLVKPLDPAALEKLLQRRARPVTRP